MRATLALNVSNENHYLILKLLCGALKGFMKAFNVFIKLFKEPQRSAKIKIKDDFLS